MEPLGLRGFSEAVCIFYEHQFRLSIGDHSRFIFFFRYIDDLRAIVAYRSSDISTKSLALDLITQLKEKTYHPKMSLELEECDGYSFKFLESNLHIQKNYFSAHWVSKNFDSLLEKGKLKFFTSQDYFSFSGDKKLVVRSATLSGRLSTLLGYKFNDVDLIKSFGLLLPELFARHFPKWKIVSACIRMFLKTKEPVWKLLAALAKLSFECKS